MRFQLGLVVMAGNLHLVECCVRSYFQEKEDGVESWDRMFLEAAEGEAQEKVLIFG